MSTFLDFLIMFLEFFKTGLFSIGGGLATMPFLYEMAENYPWFTKAELMDMIAVSESSPGPIGINMATFAGFRMGGVLGAVVATTGLVLPSFIVIILIARVIEKFKNNPYMAYMFYGLKPAVTALIAVAGINLFFEVFFRIDFKELISGFQISEFNYKAAVLFVVIIVIKRIGFFKKVHPAFYVFFGALVGIIFKLA